MPAEFYYRNDDAPAPHGIGVGALALIEHEGRLLMELRSDCGLWGLPGGAVEPDEEIEDALRREILEETNLTISEYELFGIYTDATRIVSYPGGNSVRLISFVHLVTAEDVSLLRASDESLDLRFFEVRDLAKLDIVATAIPIMARYLSEKEY